MRISRRKLNRSVRRIGEWVLPSEARGLFRRSNWTALPVLAGLLLYADSSQACLTVPPGSSVVASVHLQETVALDRATSVVHASRRAARDRWARTENPDTSGALAGNEGGGETYAGGAALAPAAAAPAVLAPPEAAARSAPPCEERAMLEGEFAVRLVESLRLRAPRGGWTPETAAATLATLRLRGTEAAGVTPAAGWRVDRPLTEGELAVLLRHLGLQLYSKRPAHVISVCDGVLILGKLNGLFRSLAPAALRVDGGASRALNLGNPGAAPLSPSTP
jgi:hypothetical protein